MAENCHGPKPHAAKSELPFLFPVHRERSSLNHFLLIGLKRRKHLSSARTPLINPAQEKKENCETFLRRFPFSVLRSPSNYRDVSWPCRPLRLCGCC